MQKGHYRKVGKRQYIIQMAMTTPEAEKVFEQTKDELCLHFHHAKAKVISREFQRKKLIARIRCVEEGFDKPRGAVRFYPGKKGVGRFFLRCGRKRRCR